VVLNELVKLDSLLLILAQQASTYDRHNKVPRHKNKPYFPPMLFNTRSGKLSDYVAESRILLTQVTDYIKNESSKALIEFQCNKLVEQCQAIKKVLSIEAPRVNNDQQNKTRSVKYLANRQQKSTGGFSWLTQRAINNTRELYLELSKHHGYRQKLSDKIQQLTTLETSTDTNDKTAIEQLILQQHKRLEQCNEAIHFIEKKIDQLEDTQNKR